MRFVQLLLTDEQAELVAAACLDAERTVIADEGEESPAAEDAKQLGRLALLFQDAAERPAKYTPTGKLAATVRSVHRRAKGAAQPKPLNKRKQRQERRIRTAKERREMRRLFTQGYNEARERLEAERIEAESAQRELEERLEKQRKFKVVTADGDLIIAGVPAEFVVDEETGESLLPKVIVP